MSVQSPGDLRGRPLGVLRLSLTARCNLACPYCCPDSEEPAGLLSLEQRVQLVQAFVSLGGHTLRLTGGEPLLHGGLEALIAAVRPLRQRSSEDPRGQLRDLALTTNGVLLTAQRAQSLRLAGLDRITLSLDGTTAATVATMAGLQGGEAAGEIVLGKVLAAIDHAIAAGFDPAVGALKLNAVITRSGNANQLLSLAELARHYGMELRLIEFMDVGNRNGWAMDEVVAAAEMVEQVSGQWPLEPISRDPHGTAYRWRYKDGRGYLGTIASISAPFCGDCNRLRITADGMAYTCLFASTGTDLKPCFQSQDSLLELQMAFKRLWTGRSDRYSEERQFNLNAMGLVDGDNNNLDVINPIGSQVKSHAEMAYLGG
jgi:cyclic pyranopterin phosphate synthase